MNNFKDKEDVSIKLAITMLRGIMGQMTKIMVEMSDLEQMDQNEE